MKLSPIVLTGAVLIVVSVALSLFFYDRIPDPVPTHFDMNGRANGFTPKPFGAFIGPLLIAVLTVVLEVLPRISPRGYRMQSFRRTYEIIFSAIIALVFFVSAVALSQAIGMSVRVDRLMLIAIALLLLLLGNFMGKLTRNFFIGIRTPWTLASEEVWFRTHRLGGWLFVAAALVLFAGAFLDAGPPLILIVVIAVGVWLIVYSYVIYRRIEGNPNEDDESVRKSGQ